MRRALVTVLTAAAAAWPTVASAGPQPFQPEDHFALQGVSDVRLAPDGASVAYVRQYVDSQHKSRTEVWLLTLADGKAHRLSAADADARSPRWSPDGHAILYLAGASRTQESSFLPAAFGAQIVVANPADGTSTVVAQYETSNEPLAYQGSGEQVSWSPDGRQIAFISAYAGPEPAGTDPFVIVRLDYKTWVGMTDNKRWQINVVSLNDKKVRRLTNEPYQDHSIAWSPRGDVIAFVSNHEPDPDRVHNYDLFTVQVADGIVHQLTHTPGCEYAPSWSPDGSQIAYLAGIRALTTRESNAEDPHPWVIASTGGTGHPLAPQLDRRASDIEWAPDEGLVYFRVDDHGNSVLYQVGADGQGLTRVLGETGSVRSFSAGKGRMLAYDYASPRAPSEVFVRTQGATRQLTHLNDTLLAQREVSIPEAFQFASFDGTQVQAFFTPPLHRQDGVRYPLIVQIHGGPHGQQGPAFVLKSQVYASHGYATLMVNYRGSAGYGQAFTDGTRKDQDGAEFKDVMAGLDAALARASYLDPDRLGVEGGSYGGQLTNWAITQTTRFKAAIPQSGISNLINLAYTHWAPDYMQEEYEGYPWQNGIAETLWQRSAVAHIANVKTPTMIVHGELDGDVSIAEAETMYNALRQVGVEAVFLRYPREGHGLRDPVHVVDAMQRSLEWYDHLVSGKPSLPGSKMGPVFEWYDSQKATLKTASR